MYKSALMNVCTYNVSLYRSNFHRCTRFGQSTAKSSSFMNMGDIIILSFIIVAQEKLKSIMTSLKMFDILPSVLLIWQIILRTALALPLDGGYGGVYNSPEANAYWARRFGSGFLKSSQSKSGITKVKSVIPLIPIFS